MRLLPALALLIAAPAFADPPPGVDPNSSTAKWFRSLKDENGRSCCGLGDCRAVRSEDKGGHWWVWIKPSWRVDADKLTKSEFGDELLVQVPDKIVQHRDDNPSGHAILCASQFQPENIMYCFIPLQGV